ncbi:MAG: hypothetical protein Q8P82_00150 [bacterium]|nr:hypothetical protein [bacterium]
MKTTFFQNEAIENIRKELAGGSAPRQELRAIAQAVLNLSDQYSADIPTEAIRPFVRMFPAFSHLFVEFLKEDDKESSKKAIDELRKTLGTIKS